MNIKKIECLYGKESSSFNLEQIEHIIENLSEEEKEFMLEKLEFKKKSKNMIIKDTSAEDDSSKCANAKENAGACIETAITEDTRDVTTVEHDTGAYCLPFKYPKEMYPENCTDYTTPPMYICGNNIYREDSYVDENTGLRVRDKTQIERWVFRQEYGDKHLRELKIFNRFYNEPGFGKDYKWLIPTVSGHNMVNLFNPPLYEPKEGRFPHVDILLEEVFGQESMLMAYDYFSIAWQHPRHELPVLVLISKENGTGKSTFLNFVRNFASGNATIMQASAFKRDFNSYVTSAFVMVEEMRNGRDVMDAIKTLSTAKTMRMNEKFEKEKDVNTGAKVILVGNDENTIIAANKYDIRYWVRKLKPYTRTIEGFEKKLYAELPAFAHFISTRNIETPDEDRGWFSREKLKTDALENIVRHSRSECCKYILDFANRIAEEQGISSVQATVVDINNYLQSYFHKSFSDREIINALRSELGLKSGGPTGNAITYKDYTGKLKTGRCYNIPAEPCNYAGADEKPHVAERAETVEEETKEEEMPF